MSDPRVSVVVATRDRPARLARLLAGLRGQTLPLHEFEVIVVDDGSGPATAATVAAAAREGLHLRSRRQPWPGGQAAARNRGWAIARAPLVAFTDDDCVPTPNWLVELLAAAKDELAAIVQGRTEPDPVEMAAHPRRVLTRSVEVKRLGPQYQTCNIAYARRLLEELGGFDESFGPGSAGEDTDLGWRAVARGAKAVFAENALVHHAVVEMDVLGALRDAWRWGETARVFARHPQARVMLVHRVFWNVWHMLLLRSLVALRAPPPLRRLLLARHAAALRRRARALGAGPASTPFLLLYDAVETASMLRGAVRHRTPLL